MEIWGFSVHASKIHFFNPFGGDLERFQSIFGADFQPIPRQNSGPKIGIFGQFFVNFGDFWPIFHHFLPNICCFSSIFTQFNPFLPHFPPIFRRFATHFCPIFRRFSAIFAQFYGIFPQFSPNIHQFSSFFTSFPQIFTNSSQFPPKFPLQFSFHFHPIFCRFCPISPNFPPIFCPKYSKIWVRTSKSPIFPPIFTKFPKITGKKNWPQRLVEKRLKIGQKWDKKWVKKGDFWWMQPKITIFTVFPPKLPQFLLFLPIFHPIPWNRRRIWDWKWGKIPFFDEWPQNAHFWRGFWGRIWVKIVWKWGQNGLKNGFFGAWAKIAFF